jgi:hypothetical protein
MPNPLKSKHFYTLIIFSILYTVPFIATDFYFIATDTSCTKTIIAKSHKTLRTNFTLGTWLIVDGSSLILGFVIMLIFNFIC